MTANPYRAPLSESLEASTLPEPGDLIPGRMEFRGTVTRQNHREAVTVAGIRKEFESLTRAMLALGGVFVLFASVLLLAGDDLSASGVLRTVTASVLFLGGITIFCVNHRWLLGTQLPSYQLIAGPVRGWIDRETLYVEAENHQSYCPLSQLVATAFSDDLWVFSFATDLTFWHAIPFEGFDDPSVARAVAQELERVRPPRTAVVIDERKRSTPDAAFRFERDSGAVSFEGDFHEDAAAGTRLIRATQAITRRTWMSLAILLGSVLASLLVLAGLQLFYISLAAIWLLFLIGNVYFRVWRARRRSKHDGRVVAWNSKGWIDEHGYCAMTVLGQSRSRWRFFDHHEITDDAICLYPHASDACCCLISREQFADPQAWDRAVALVDRKLAGPANVG